MRHASRRGLSKRFRTRRSCSPKCSSPLGFNESLGASYSLDCVYRSCQPPDLRIVVRLGERDHVKTPVYDEGLPYTLQPRRLLKHRLGLEGRRLDQDARVEQPSAPYPPST